MPTSREKFLKLHNLQEWRCKTCKKDLSLRSIGRKDRKVSGLCRPCGMVGKNNPAYKTGKPQCLNCGKSLKLYRRKRCKPCFRTWYIGENTFLHKNNKNWRDSSIRSYDYVHLWLKQHYGKATNCQNKQCEKKSTIFEWAKITDANYELKRENFLQLCRSCHRKYDWGKIKL